MNTIFFLISDLVNIVTIAVSIITTAICHRSLNKWINTFSATLTEIGNHTDKLIQDRRKIAIRSFLYPLSTCVTLPFEAIFLILNTFGIFFFKLALPVAVTTGLADIITEVAFSIDPTVHKAFIEACGEIEIKDWIKSHLKIIQVKAQLLFPYHKGSSNTLEITY